MESPAAEEKVQTFGAKSAENAVKIAEKVCLQKVCNGYFVQNYSKTAKNH